MKFSIHLFQSMHMTVSRILSLGGSTSRRGDAVLHRFSDKDKGLSRYALVRASAVGGWTAGFERVKTESGLPQESVASIVSNLMIWMLMLFGFISIIGFVIAGILYLTAAGNDNQIKSAKSAMTWSIVGVIVALMGYVIIYAVDVWLGGGTNF